MKNIVSGSALSSCSFYPPPDLTGALVADVSGDGVGHSVQMAVSTRVYVKHCYDLYYMGHLSGHLGEGQRCKEVLIKRTRQKYLQVNNNIMKCAWQFWYFCA